MERRSADARRGRPPRLPARLARLLARCRAAQGDLSRCVRAEGPAAARRLSELRALGLARTVILFDPRKAGREVECVVLLRLRSYAPEAVREVERRFLEDPDVISAARVCGRFDYQLTVFHPHLRAARAWRRVVESRPEIAALEQRFVVTHYGEPTAGALLWAGGRRGVEGRAASRVLLNGRRHFS